MKTAPKKTDQINIRGSDADLGAFRRLCDTSGFETSEILRDLMRAALDYIPAYCANGRWYPPRLVPDTPAKTAKRKPAPIVIPVMAELAEAMERAPREGPLMPRICVQQSGRGDELSKRMARMIREAGEGDTQAGKASFHSLRATFISMMDEAGAPQAVTDSITGHAPQTMHARYSHPDTEAARNWMEKALPRLDTHLDTV